jgi:hypothetical protein
MTTDQRQQRKKIALLIAVRERCEDCREKMETNQLRWLERESFFPSRSCIRASNARRFVSSFSGWHRGTASRFKMVAPSPKQPH